MPGFKNYILTLFLFIFSISLKAQTVFKTPSGAKYHLAACGIVKNVSEEITISIARELGLQPCKTCQPDNLDGHAPVIHKAQGKAQLFDAME